MKLVGYCRVSTDDKGQNPERQADLLRAWAARNGHEIAAMVLDEGTSGGVSPMERVWVQQAIKKAKEHGAEGILVESVDRWTRKGPLDFFQSSADIELRHGLKLHLADVPQGMEGMALEIYQSIMAIVAKAFRERLREQITSGLARAKREGWKNGRPGQRPKPNLSPEEIAYVREMKALGRRGPGWGRMAMELTRRRGALEVVDVKARVRRTVTPGWLRMEWYRILDGRMVRTWARSCKESPVNVATPGAMGGAEPANKGEVAKAPAGGQA
jgi:DNA invertase Pin-like site-specific DNA recombinase